MLRGREQHNALIAIAVSASALGALGLTIGVFMHYGSDEFTYLPCGLCGGGCLSLCLGIAVGKYTKWRSRR